MHCAVLKSLVRSSQISFSNVQTNWMNSLSSDDWINWINKLTLKDNTVSCCFALFTCGGPCHLSSFKQSSGILLSSEDSLFIQFRKKQHISEFVLFPHYYFRVLISSPKLHSAPLHISIRQGWKKSHLQQQEISFFLMSMARVCRQEHTDIVVFSFLPKTTESRAWQQNITVFALIIQNTAHTCTLQQLP